MGRLANWLSGKFRRDEPRNQAFDEPFWQEILFGASYPTKAGVHVNWDTALETPAALRCGMLISDGVSTVPCKLMRKVGNDRQEAVDHPVYDLLYHTPCSWMTSQQWRETNILRAVFCGESFNFINRVSSGKVMEIFPFDVGEVVTQRLPDRSIGYFVNGEQVPADRMLHFRGPSWNSRNGLNMVRLAQETIGLARATMEAHSGLFGNGIQSSGVYSVDGTLDKGQHERLTEYLRQHYVKNKGAPLILDRKATWQGSGMKGVDAEHLATRQYQDSQIATMFGVLPIMLGIADKTATYASSEQMFLAHCTHTIRPWHVRVAEIFDCRLLTRQERADGYYFNFVDSALLRGDAQARAEFYKVMWSIGAFSANDALSFEDVNGFKGGDQHYVQGASARIKPDGSLELAAQPDATSGNNPPSRSPMNS